MHKTRLSSKGQVVIPKALRMAHGWESGFEFAVIETDDGILLKPLCPFAPTSIEEVLGCAGYKGPRKSLKEIEAAIAKGAREQR